MANEKYYTQRIQRLKKRVLDTPPEVDIENAVIVTKAFQETEGQPHYYQKAYSVYKTLLEKSIPIWEDELIVGNSGSKQRSGLVCPDDCWAFLDREMTRSTAEPMTRSNCGTRIARRSWSSSSRIGRAAPSMISGTLRSRRMSALCVTAAFCTLTGNAFAAGVS